MGVLIIGVTKDIGIHRLDVDLICMEYPITAKGSATSDKEIENAKIQMKQLPDNFHTWL